MAFTERVPESLSEYQAWAYAQARQLREQERPNEAFAFIAEMFGDLAYVIAQELKDESSGEGWKNA